MIKDAPKITIIIPVVNIEAEYLSRLIISLYKYTASKNFNIIILKNDWRGFAKVINEGLRMFLSDKDSDYVVMLNDDTLVMPKWDYFFIRIAQHHSAEGVKVGAVGDAFTRLQGNNIAFWGVMFPRKVIEEVGLLNEQYVNGVEDIEYCDRLKKAGYEIFTTKYNFIQHAVSTTIDLIPESIKKQMDKQNKDIYEASINVNKTEYKKGGEIVDKPN